MKQFLLLLLCSACLMAQDDVVFRGVPTVRVVSTIDGEERQKLDAAAGLKSECVVVLRRNKYYWASRNNAPLIRVDAGQFTYFIHTGPGGGYIKVLTGSRETAKAPADYIENINQRFEVVTYWGRVSTDTATAASR